MLEIKPKTDLPEMLAWKYMVGLALFVESVGQSCSDS